jgi:hypothetical protein
LKLLANLFAFFSFKAYFAKPFCWVSELENPIFYLTASATVPPTSYIPSIPKCIALEVALLGTYLSYVVNLGLSYLIKNGVSYV